LIQPLPENEGEHPKGERQAPQVAAHQSAASKYGQATVVAQQATQAPTVQAPQVSSSSVSTGNSGPQRSGRGVSYADLKGRQPQVPQAQVQRFQGMGYPQQQVNQGPSFVGSGARPAWGGGDSI